MKNTVTNPVSCIDTDAQQRLSEIAAEIKRLTSAKADAGRLTYEDLEDCNDRFQTHLEINAELHDLQTERNQILQDLQNENDLNALEAQIG